MGWLGRTPTKLDQTIEQHFGHILQQMTETNHDQQIQLVGAN